MVKYFPERVFNPVYTSYEKKLRITCSSFKFVLCISRQINKNIFFKYKTCKNILKKGTTNGYVTVK